MFIASVATPTQGDRTGVTVVDSLGVRRSKPGVTRSIQLPALGEITQATPDVKGAKLAVKSLRDSSSGARRLHRPRRVALQANSRR